MKKENGMMNDEITNYLRFHPHWYITLSRYPSSYDSLVIEYKELKSKHFMERIEQVSMFLNMIEMMM